VLEAIYHSKARFIFSTHKLIDNAMIVRVLTTSRRVWPKNPI
jgi:hypothetical protein